MKKAPVRSGISAWGVLGFIGELATRLDSGHKTLRRIAPKAAVLHEIITLGTFLVGGIAQTLAALEEAADILIEVAPSVADVKVGFESDFSIWSAFRDDAAHVADRTFREPVDDRHDALLDARSGETLVIGYNFSSDTIETGTSSLCVESAIARALAFYDRATLRVNEETRRGQIPRP